MLKNQEQRRKQSIGLPSDSDSEEDDYYHFHHYIPRKRRKTIVEEDPEKRRCDPNEYFEENSIVRVHREGSHKYGGDGTVVATYLDEDGERRYKIRYIIHNYTEDYIHQKYVSAFE